ncbi:hypothetical protein TEA_015027 [Camellia sinensis var. sinensis]|uniref:Glycosyltransferase N-terminal domain-containing protein n=1 Tax=Camellia sinensis var. sinensis TaxID=542762 RepID=A0A4V3WLJ0_CAMSN|nr:hypothetical protein TEA_015027 [Camellia sinensis var. sinensis]
MGSRSVADEKPHVVCVPFPAQGHVNPFLKLSKLLHTKGFHITFVNTEHNHKRLLKSRGTTSLVSLPDFTFETIPDGLPPDAADDTTQQHIPSLCQSTKQNCPVPFRELLHKLNHTNVPPVTCVVVDGAMSFTLKVCEELGIPNMVFWTTSACGFLGYKQCVNLMERGIIPFKGRKDIRMKDLPRLIRKTDPNDIILNFLKGEMEEATKASATILLTFDALEHDILDALSLLFPCKIYAIGPLQLHLDQNTENILMQEQLVEFAWGLANSKKDFLWMIRPDLALGGAQALPTEFIAETKERGLIHHRWSAHDLWPFSSEQQVNCLYACTEWDIGMAIDGDDVGKNEVEKLVRELMEGEKGKMMKNKAMNWKRKSQDATGPGGSSYLNFERLLDEMLLLKS